MENSTSKIQLHLKNNPHMYVSITGLKIRSPFKILIFFWHAIRSKSQADQAPGILFSQVRKINGIQHTLTAWENKKQMQAYIYSGHHAKAIRVFRKIAQGKTFGFESRELPSWDDVHRLWQEKGNPY